MNNVTACLITRDKKYPMEIQLNGFGEVLIRTESPSVYERYKLAMEAKNDIIYVQDDDCIVDYDELWRYYNGSITNAITDHHFRAYQGTGATLVGWGCFFPKSALACFAKYIERYGEDAHLLREADRIFTVMNQPHNTIIRNHHDFRPQVERMWQESNHWSSMAEAIQKTRALL